MLTEVEARAIAQKVVDAAKATAHVDTGALKRSISFTYVKGVIIFRQLYYGVFYENSRLEKYAAKYIPSNQEWKLISTNFGGETIEVGKTRTGRATTRTISKTTAPNTTKNIRRLIEINRAKRKKEQDNGEA